MDEVSRATMMHGRLRDSRKVSSPPSKKPLSARLRIFHPDGSMARASVRKAIAPRPAVVLPLRNQPCSAITGSARTGQRSEVAARAVLAGVPQVCDLFHHVRQLSLPDFVIVGPERQE